MNAFTKQQADAMILVAKVSYFGGSCRHDCGCGATWFNETAEQEPCPYCGTTMPVTIIGE